MKTYQFKINGMHCEACIKLIKMEFQDVAGIHSSEIDYKSGIATIEADDTVAPTALIAAIKNAGYDSQETTESAPALPAKKSWFGTRGSVSNKALLFIGIVLLVGLTVAVAGRPQILATFFGNSANPFESTEGYANRLEAGTSNTGGKNLVAGCSVTENEEGCPMMERLGKPNVTSTPAPSPSAPVAPNQIEQTNPASSAPAPPVPGTANITKDSEDVQVVRMTQTAYGYEPNKFTIKKGVPVKWIITSETSRSCAASIRVDDYDILQGLDEGENIIEFTPAETGVVDFSCGMGMYTGQFNVI